MKRVTVTVTVTVTIVVAAMLAGCASVPAPVYGPPQPPAPPPRPGTKVMVADWMQPLNASALCGGSPFACTGPQDAQWGLLQPIDAQQFSTDGTALQFHTRIDEGMALIRAETVDGSKPLSLRVQVRVDALDCKTVAYVGGVLYGGGVDDGDPTGNYEAEYISCPGDGGTPRLWIYRPTWAGPVGSITFELGRTYELGIDVIPGESVTYLVDKQAIYQETAGSNHGLLTFPHDPHPALWFGSGSGTVGSFDVYAGP